MDEQAAIVFGTLVGAAIGSIGLVIVLGVKLWPGVKRLLTMTSQVAKDVDEALGPRTLENSDVDESGERKLRRATGTFQTIMRAELDEHDKKLDRRLDELDRRSDRRFDRIEEAIEELTESQRLQAHSLAELTRSHGRVAARTAEHSAVLNVAKAEETMTKGKIPK